MKDQKNNRKHILRLLVITIRAWVWVSALLFTRIVKQCEQKIAEKDNIPVPEAVLGNREGEGQGKASQTVTR